MQNMSSTSKVYAALCAGAAPLLKLRISDIQIRTSANGQLAWVKGRTIDGQSLYAEIVIPSSTDEASESGGSQRASTPSHGVLG